MFEKISSSDRVSVSAYIPTRDRPDSLRRALASVMAQTFPLLEIIVVDDASNYDVSAIISVYAGPYPIRLLRNEIPIGAPASRNRALKEARGTWVAGLDDDDEWLPERIASLMILAKNHDTRLVATGDWLIDTTGRRLRRTPPPRIDFQAILRRNAIGNQALFLRQAALDIGGFDETLEAAQDHDFWIRLISHFGCAYALAKPLQNIYANSIGITASPRRRRGYWRVYRKHRPSMLRNTAAIHLYGLHKASGKQLTFRLSRVFFVRGNRLRVLARLAGENLPFLQNTLQAIASIACRWRA